MAKPTEMELRVAKRIGAYYGLHGEKNVKKHINVARAAIRAMRQSVECDEGIFTPIKIEYVKKTQKEKQG